jgi:hypothetical protein
VRRSHNVGRSLGRLYCVNTLGSSLAALAAVMFLMGALGQRGVVTLAAALNLLVGAGALALHVTGRGRTP